MIRFVAAAVAMPAVLVLGFELSLAGTEGGGWSVVAEGFDRAFRVLPWPGGSPFRVMMAAARRPQVDVRVYVEQAREGLGPVPAAGLRLDRERFRIYAHELGETGVLLVVMTFLAPLVGRDRRARGALIGLTVLDLWGLARHRPIDLTPIRPLTEQSPVLGRLAALPRGTRTIDLLRNLPMVAGAAPLRAYRTLDLPVAERLTQQAHRTTEVGNPGGRREALDAMRASGAALRVFEPSEMYWVDERPPGGTIEFLNDPALASWLYGTAWVATTPRGAQATRFALWRPEVPAARAWLVPLAACASLAKMRAGTDDPAEILRVLERARPLVSTAPLPECLDVEINAQEDPALVVITQLADPEWQAHWRGPGGDRPAVIERVFGGWQAVNVPGPGPWRLELRYRGRDVWIGAAISASAWAIWLLTWFWNPRLPRRSAARTP